jgi:hypothetical protein
MSAFEDWPQVAICETFREIRRQERVKKERPVIRRRGHEGGEAGVPQERLVSPK